MKKNQVVLNGITFNYELTDDLLWLEDDVSKSQWGWEAEPINIKTEDRELPDQLMLGVVKIALENGGRTKGCRLSLEPFADDPAHWSLTVDFIVECCGLQHSMSRALFLEAVWIAPPLAAPVVSEAAPVKAHDSKPEGDATKPWWQKL